MIKYCYFEVKVFLLDINECADKNGGCEQVCTNTEGSFNCSCQTGFMLTNNVFCSGNFLSSCELLFINLPYHLC